MEFRAQGATEYLVLLAVVLIIALVGIALLGFFPGTASDAQIAESQIYWRSASPISITESAARATSPVCGRATAACSFARATPRAAWTWPVLPASNTPRLSARS